MIIEDLYKSNLLIMQNSIINKKLAKVVIVLVVKYLLNELIFKVSAI